MITAITAFNIMLATVTVTSPLAALSLSFLFRWIFFRLRFAFGKFLRSIGISSSFRTAGNCFSMLVLPLTIKFLPAPLPALLKRPGYPITLPISSLPCLSFLSTAYAVFSFRINASLIIRLHVSTLLWISSFVRFT